MKSSSYVSIAGAGGDIKYRYESSSPVLAEQKVDVVIYDDSN